ncbi:MAG: DUF4263 domain-containing protein [Bacteroidetes bacterium]|nr:DUF4263 domain-containing protein [Bacteroidota bacterium]
MGGGLWATPLGCSENFMNSTKYSKNIFSFSNSSLFKKDEIELFEKDILFNSHATENDASKFFARYPVFLKFGNTAELKREVVLINNINMTNQRIDFFKRNYGKKYWDIIELKSPQSSFVTHRKGLHPRISSIVNSAIHQALDYRDKIISDSEIKNNLLSKGIAVCRPQILVIVGKEQSINSSELMEILLDRIKNYGPVEAITYNHIYEFAKENYKTNNVALIPSNNILIGDYIVEHVSDGIIIDTPFPLLNHGNDERTDILSKTVVIQVNGRLRERIFLSNAVKLEIEDIQNIALQSAKVNRYVPTKNAIKKTIYIRDKLLNIVVG